MVFRVLLSFGPALYDLCTNVAILRNIYVIPRPENPNTQIDGKVSLQRVELIAEDLRIPRGHLS